MQPEFFIKFEMVYVFISRILPNSSFLLGGISSSPDDKTPIMGFFDTNIFVNPDSNKLPIS